MPQPELNQFLKSITIAKAISSNCIIRKDGRFSGRKKLMKSAKKFINSKSRKNVFPSLNASSSFHKNKLKRTYKHKCPANAKRFGFL
jgi:hypothetical protein